MDVLWFRLPRAPDEPHSIDLKAGPGHFVGLIDRREYWQVAWVIPKGGIDEVHARGLEAFRQGVVDMLPTLADRVAELRDWDQIKLLTVRADRLRRWYRPGYLAIGDAAHAMSPVAGVGINLAIQDAVEAANLLWRPLRAGNVSPRVLARIQFRRELPVRVTQAMQGLVQERLLRPTLGGESGVRIPAMVRWLLQSTSIAQLPAQFVAYGIMRPHVRSPLA
jgi:2-polyprenyl-6-methoxyphenol hydroxylase-like FAD-dependent oxidoreductase